jgi:hypothetical protein
LLISCQSENLRAQKSASHIAKSPPWSSGLGFRVYKKLASTSTTPSFSSSPILVVHVYFQVIDGHIFFFFFMDKNNALKVFNFSPTLTQ